jgi:formate dehydrogenase maturation protein FdhE
MREGIEMQGFPYDDLLELPEEQRRRFEFLKAVFRGQEHIWNDPYRGLSFDPFTSNALASFQRESLMSVTTIASQLSASSFNLEVFRRALPALVNELQSQGLEPQLDTSTLVETMREDLVEVVSSTLDPSESDLGEMTERFGAPPSMMSIIGEALLQPPLMQLASVSEKEYLDSWRETACPVCGHDPIVAIKTESEVWRFKCSYCRAEYRTDIFKCPYCGETGHDNKEFLILGDSQEFEIASCSQCRRYYKIINKVKLKKSMPEGFEDLNTYFLDYVAQDRGLERLDADGPDER